MLRMISTLVLILLFVLCLFYLLPATAFPAYAGPAVSLNCDNPSYKYEWDGQQCWLIAYCDGVAISKIPATDGACN